MPAPDHCPRCGAALPAGAPAGLCPRCLLREGMDLGQPTAVKGPSQTWAVLDGRSSVEVFAGVATESPPVVLPGSPEVTAPAATGRYEILGEIARGGMGAVLLGRDPALGRELAVKVLLPDHRDRPAMVRRFVEEAQIGGQLQHPGVVPVYDVGVFADHRPFFAMKLVRGRTLAALLDERGDPSDDLPRFVGIFESVCQAVAYAHAHKVIHRDLKPSNVMVGSFGEVQVMDWGLAKVLETGGVAAEPDSAPGGSTARHARQADASRDGSVMGTAAYMAPEQARGEVDRLDERCDVFALGGMLCEILTGRPPFAAPSRSESLRLAAAGDTSDALARLDSCGADPQLLALARGCLETDATARLRDAGEVARAMAAYLAGVQERVRAAELARVEAQARAEEERKRRRAELRPDDRPDRRVRPRRARCGDAVASRRAAPGRREPGQRRVDRGPGPHGPRPGPGPQAAGARHRGGRHLHDRCERGPAPEGTAVRRAAGRAAELGPGLLPEIAGGAGERPRRPAGRAGRGHGTGREALVGGGIEGGCPRRPGGGGAHPRAARSRAPGRARRPARPGAAHARWAGS